MRKRGMLFFLLLGVFSLLGCGAGSHIVKAETEAGTETGAAGETETVQESKAAPEPIVRKNDGVRWQDFVRDMGMGWNLGNTLDAIDWDGLSDELDYEGVWVPGSVKTTRELIQMVKAQGFRTVRVPVSWHNHVDITTDENGKKHYRIRERWMKRVREVVDYCYDEGMYVIINIHHDDKDKKFIYPTEDCREQSIDYITQLWTQIATEFAEYDHHLIYEVFNEVRLVGTNDEWTPSSPASLEAQLLINEYAQAGVDAIRSVASGYNESRFIMCMGYAGNIYSYKNMVLPTDKGGYPNRIMVSVHPYAPANFCMEVWNGKSVFDEEVQASVKDVFRLLKREWTSKDVPVVISEWGTKQKWDNGEARIKHASYYVRQAVTACKDSAGNTVPIPCLLWDNATLGDPTQVETFGFLDREHMKWFDQEYVDAIIEAAKGGS